MYGVGCERGVHYYAMQYIDGQPLDVDRLFFRHLPDMEALLGHPVVGPSWEGFARLNFATSRPILTEVIERMAKALGR